MAFELPKLDYGFNALEPHIDEKTMKIHHDKHHAAYVKNLNTALEGQKELKDLKIEEILSDIAIVPDDIQQTVINNGGGHANHSLFWAIMSPKGGNPTGKVSEAINSQFGSLDGFKEDFAKAGMTRFGSGWVWLVVDEVGKLQITSTPNQDSPLMNSLKPILGLDVWEHAYYLNYQNKRADYITAWWNVVNWDEVNKNFEVALG